jgi:hypothetical protein
VKPGRATTVAVMRSHFQTVPPARWRYVNSRIECELCANSRRTYPEHKILTPLHCPTQTRPLGKGRSGRRVLGCRRPLRDKGRGNYFFAMNVYLPLSADSVSVHMTVHLPSPLNLAFTTPFLVSYTAHTSSDLPETDHS